jgi:predicted dithiol-disulfide oxidoreductase (DUF899 family)
MVHEVIEGSLRQTNLASESGDYLARREELRLAEIELMRQRERVAELRRHLPQGPKIQDYVFEEGPANLDEGDTPIRKVRMSELFTAPNRPLVVYHFMYGKKQSKPCPMCTMLIDGWEGVAHHVAQNADVVIVAAADPAALRAHARKRGWYNLRLLSCGDNTFKYDFGSEDREGGAGFHLVGFHQGWRRHSSPFLYGSSVAIPGGQGTRHGSGIPRLQHSGSHPPGPGELVRVVRLCRQGTHRPALNFGGVIAWKCRGGTHHFARVRRKP